MEELNKLAECAVKNDQTGQFESAIFYYKKAAQQVMHLIEQGILPADGYNPTVEKYLSRARQLMNEGNNVNACIPPYPLSSPMPSRKIQNKEQDCLRNAQKMIDAALLHDENDNRAEAIGLYIETAEFCVEKSRANDNECSDKLRALANLALDRAEALKRTQQHGSMSSIPSAPVLTDDENNFVFPAVPTEEVPTFHANTPSSSSTLPLPHQTKNRRRWSDKHKEGKSVVDKYNANELRVLSTTSRVNTRVYMPFIKECDLKEPFSLAIPFSDKDGLLPLSEKQKKHLKSWMRPDDFMPDPKVIDRIDSGTIKQTVVSDCSFVASLAVCARFENRFGTRLITNIIYPQNKNGDPIHNPCGKYMIILHINGIPRKVIIDDFLPISTNGDLLCSATANKNELWVSLLEKAYMKVMGGYDFPGSNSNIDLNALTGWIPERIPIRAKEASFDADKTFERLFTHFHQGHCLLTLATGQMEESEQNRTGLVDAHAYAVLDLRKIDGKRLFLVKNPWTHLRWKGRFSEKDTESWTPELQKVLDYNPKDAQQFDDGIFWIDYASICAFFDVFYVNWNPTLFPFRYTLHASWDAGRGPVKDLYTVGENPQYFLEVNNRHGISSVWILLSRHITEKEDFANNREYITVMVYKNEGKRVYLPFDPKPITEGTRINSPHYLCQLTVRDPGLQRFTLVIAQYEKMKTIHYTLRVYSSAEFRCGNINVPYKFHKKESAEWKGATAGGCGNGPSLETYQNNPLFHIKLDDDSDDNALLVDLRGPKEYSIGFEVALVSSVRDGKTFERRDSGVFRPGYTVLQLDSLPAGTYSVRPMTFLANQEGPLILGVHSSCNFSLKRIQ